MFPQPDAETLARNPQFALLWKDLTTNKMTRDGVSKTVALDRETVKTREMLRSKQIELAKREVLKDVVRAVAFGEGEGALTGELRETAQIVSAQLDGKLDPQDKDIVQVEVEEFMANIETVRTAVETHMEQNVVLLCQILDPTQQQADPSTLPAQVQALQTDVDEAKWQLGVQRIELASTLTQLLKTNAQLLQAAIRILEQLHKDLRSDCWWQGRRWRGKSTMEEPKSNWCARRKSWMLGARDCAGDLGIASSG
ncbi:hypothetical protein KCU83_g8751, partial [Aureobasidium melanogenum]